MKKLILGICAMALVAVFSSCEKDRIVDIHAPITVGYTDAEYAALSEVLDLPRHVHDYKGASTFKLATQATLGRVLFYDKALSKDFSVSCASCHKQEAAFADTEALSTGIYDRLTDRNSIGLGSFVSFSAEYGGGGNGGSIASRPLFWDMRAESVHSQMIQTIANSQEMGMSMTDVVNRVREQPHYQILFEKAFLTQQITSERVLDALAAYMQAMTADQSRFDQARGFNNNVFDLITDFHQFSSQENLGKALFVENCTPCHMRSVLSINGLDVANNGLELESIDLGVASHTGQQEDIGMFKIPMLRNVALSGPYMHDGRFGSLEEVIDFYNEGIQPHENLDMSLVDPDTGGAKRMDLSQDDKDALLAFLHTLTDMSELGTEKFADPWLD